MVSIQIIKKAVNIMLTLIFVFSACFILGKLFFGSKKPVFMFNHATFVVISPSMEPQYPTNCLIIIRKTPVEKLKIGDAIVFKADALNGDLAFHRIVRITDEGIFVKGDNNQHEDNQAINNNSYVGLCVSKSVFLGKLIKAISSPLGLLTCVVVPFGSYYLVYKALKIFKEREKQ